MTSTLAAPGSRSAGTAPRPPTGTRRRGAAAQESRAGVLLSAPFVVLYVVFLVGPALYGLAMSFFRSTTLTPGLGGFAGLSNYASVLTEPDFWASMGHTVYFTVLTTPPMVIVAMLLALLVHRMKRGTWFYRFVFFAPGVIPVSSAVLIFGWLFTPNTGLIADWLTAVGLTPPDFLGDASWAMPSVAILTVWWSIGFNFVLFTAALQDIPRELYEAASLDGASAYQQTRFLTIPLLGRTTQLVTMLQILGSLQVFDQIYQLTSGGPDYATRPVMEFIYDSGFTDHRAGYAAAASMIYFVLVVGLSLSWRLLAARRRTNTEQARGRRRLMTS